MLINSYYHTFILIMLLILANCDINDDSTMLSCLESNQQNSVSASEWTKLGNIETDLILTIKKHPCLSNTLFIGTSRNFSTGAQGKLFRSDDFGKSWDIIWEGGSISQIIFDRTNPNVIYANPHGVIKSTNGGGSWSQIDKGLEINSELSVLSLTADPIDPNRIYAGTAGFGSGWFYFSEDKGEHWTPVPGKGESENSNNDNFNLANGVSHSALLKSEKPERIVLSTSVNSQILITEDSGLNWTLLIDEDFTTDINPIAATDSFDKILGFVQETDYTKGGILIYDFSLETWVLNDVPDSLKQSQPHGFGIVDSEILFLCTEKGFFSKNDHLWSKLTENISLGKIVACHIQKNNIYIVISESQNTNTSIYVRSFL
jgi:hypothetical protein